MEKGIHFSQHLKTPAHHLPHFRTNCPQLPLAKTIWDQIFISPALSFCVDSTIVKTVRNLGEMDEFSWNEELQVWSHHVACTVFALLEHAALRENKQKVRVAEM